MTLEERSNAEDRVDRIKAAINNMTQGDRLEKLLQVLLIRVFILESKLNGAK